MTISELLLPEYDREMESTRKLLACLPEDKLDYKPHEKSMTLGRLAGHTAEMAGWIGMLSGDGFDVPAGWKPTVATSREQLLGMFDANAANGRKVIASMSDEDFGKPWSLSMGGKVAFTKPKLEIVRSIAMNHMIHHRAQLGVYFRLNGVAIPGMYGPSADDKAGMQAGSGA